MCPGSLRRDKVHLIFDRCFIIGEQSQNSSLPFVVCPVDTSKVGHGVVEVMILFIEPMDIYYQCEIDYIGDYL